MSRTYKDAPARVRLERLAKKRGLRESPVLNFEHERNIYAIFYAHEVAEKAELIERAEELGYEVDEKEVTGYLGYHKPAYHRVWASSAFSDLIDTTRAIYLQPLGTLDHLQWSHDGFNTEKTEKENYGFEDSELAFLMNPREQVSNKKNIFVVVTLTKTFQRKYRHLPYEAVPSSDLVTIYGRDRSGSHRSEPSKAEFRATATKVRELYNSGDGAGAEEAFEAVEAHSEQGFQPLPEAEAAEEAKA